MVSLSSSAGTLGGFFFNSSQVSCTRAIIGFQSRTAARTCANVDASDCFSRVHSSSSRGSSASTITLSLRLAPLALRAPLWSRALAMIGWNAARMRAPMARTAPVQES